MRFKFNKTTSKKYDAIFDAIKFYSTNILIRIGAFVVGIIVPVSFVIKKLNMNQLAFKIVIIYVVVDMLLFISYWIVKRYFTFQLIPILVFDYINAIFRKFISIYSLVLILIILNLEKYYNLEYIEIALIVIKFASISIIALLITSFIGMMINNVRKKSLEDLVKGEIMSIYEFTGIFTLLDDAVLGNNSEAKQILKKQFIPHIVIPFIIVISLTCLLTFPFIKTLIVTIPINLLMYLIPGQQISKIYVLMYIIRYKKKYGITLKNEFYEYIEEQKAKKQSKNKKAD